MKEEVHLIVLLLYALSAFGASLASHVTARLLEPQAKYRPASRQLQGMVQAARVGSMVGAWYGISVTLTLFNKWLLTYWRGGSAFPVSMSAGHIVIKAILARCLIHNRRSPFFAEPLYLPWTFSLKFIVPVGVATALDVILSNVSFRFVTVTFYTILKSASLMWILLWAVLLRVERCSFSNAATCVVMSIGLALASFGETDLSIPGAILVLSAGACAGLRWALTQKLMVEDSVFRNPLLMLSSIAAPSALSSIILAVAVEGRQVLAAFHSTSADAGGGGGGGWAWQVFGELALATVVGGLVAFFLILVEIKLLELTSSVTLGVFGTIKELLQIILAILAFQDKVSWLNLVGLAVAILGTEGYRRLKQANGGHGSKQLEDYPKYQYNPVQQADLELEAFGEVTDDEQLSDGWDDLRPDALEDAPPVDHENGGP